MSVVRCPRCGERVMSPDGVEPEVRVRCPLCAEDYSLHEAQIGLPPALIVLDETTDIVFADAAADQDLELRVSESSRRQAIGSFEFETSPPPPLHSRRTVRTQRVARRKKSVFAEMSKIVAGGIVGLGIGQVILWWGLDRDPLDAGPQVARVAAWAVPDHFRGTAAFGRFDDAYPTHTEPLPHRQNQRDGVERTRIEPALPLTPQDVDRTLSDVGELTAREPLNQIGQVAFDRAAIEKAGTIAAEVARAAQDPSFPGVTNQANIPEMAGISSAETVPSVISTSDSPITSANSAVDLPSAVDVPSIELALELNENPEPATSDGLNSVDEPEAPRSQLAMPESTSISSTAGQPEIEAIAEEPAETRLPNSTDSLADQVAETLEAMAHWDAAGEIDVAQHRQVAARLYSSLAEMGKIVSTNLDALDSESTELNDRIQELLQEIAADPEKVSLVRQVAPSWIAARGPENGVLVSGTVRSSSVFGRLLEIQFEIGSDMILTAFCHGRDQDFAIGSEYLLLGRMTTQPRETIEGYNGTENRVIIGRMHTPLVPNQPEIREADHPD